MALELLRPYFLAISFFIKIIPVGRYTIRIHKSCFEAGLAIQLASRVRHDQALPKDES